MIDLDSIRELEPRFRVRRWLIGAAASILLFSVATGFWLEAEADSSTEPVPFERTKAADFSVDLIGGGTFTLSEHLRIDGRPVVLNFWASWCGPCRAEMPAFEEVARQNPSVLFVGIAVADDLEAALQFAEEIGVSYPLGVDTTETIASKYPFIGLPTTWFIDGEGRIAREFIGQIQKADLLQFLADDLGV